MNNKQTEKEKKISSHIQMPKSVLKRFENQHHRYYYYDVKRRFIGTNGHAGSTNIELGFYSHEIEGFLNSEIETPFSKLYEAIDEISIDPPRGNIDSHFDYVAKRFVYALLARNPNAIDRIKKDPLINELFSSQQTRDLGMTMGFAAEMERDFLSNYGTTIAINSTDVPFILPTCGAYCLNIFEIEHIVLPVSPTKAIVFVEESGKGQVVADGVFRPYFIEDEVDAAQFNIAAFSTQCRYGNGFVVSPDKSALENAQNEVNPRDIHLSTDQTKDS